MICRNCFKKTRASSLKKWLFRVKTLNWPFQMSHINALFFRVYDPFANIRSQHSSSPHLNQYTYIDFTENETFLSISATSRTVRSHAFTHFACEIPHTFRPRRNHQPKIIIIIARFVLDRVHSPGLGVVGRFGSMTRRRLERARLPCAAAALCQMFAAVDFVVYNSTNFNIRICAISSKHTCAQGRLGVQASCILHI